MRERRSTTVLGDLIALAVLLVALLLPDRLTRTDLGSFAAVPVELILAGVLLVVLPDRARRPVAAALGVALGLLTVLKIIDIGFYAALARPFDLVLDWTLRAGGLGSAAELAGRHRAALVVAAAALLVLAVLAGSSGRVSGWPGCSAPAPPGPCPCSPSWPPSGSPAPPPASAPSRPIRWPRPPARPRSSVRSPGSGTGLVDQERFAAELAQDRFRDCAPRPAPDRAAGQAGAADLRGELRPGGVDRPRDRPGGDRSTRGRDESARLGGGWQARSGYLTSPIAGGGSWLAHATLLSGLWVDTQRRYRHLVASDRLTLTRAFGGAGWRTIGVMPGNTTAWPDGDVYAYDEIHDSRHSATPDRRTGGRGCRISTRSPKPSGC